MAISDRRHTAWVLIAAASALVTVVVAAAGWRLGLFQPTSRPELPATRAAPPIVESVDVRSIPEAGEAMTR